MDPNLRRKLLNEARTPFRGLRRVLWGALFGSAALGLIIMGIRSSSGQNVFISDISIQIGALTIFGVLLLIDKSKTPD